MTTIKQTDRDVAAEMFYYMDGTPERSDAIRAGLRDDMDYVQAFARHRIAAEQRGMIAARDAAVKVAEDAARCWRNFAKMNLPSSPSPVINEDRAKICDNLAQSIATMPMTAGGE